MANTFGAKLSRRIKSLARFAFSKRAIPTLKGVLAYVLLFVFSFLRGYDEINPFVNALPSAVIMTIASMPGATMGSCIQNTFFNMMGVLVGSLDSFILAKLSQVPVAQGVVFALMVYLVGILYAQSPMFIGFCLLTLLNSFTGIFTSLANGGEFIPSQLLGYIQAYSFAAAIVLFVNFCIFPRTAESALREALVRSLEHARTFLHLIHKGHTVELGRDERAVMEQLVQTLRADYGVLNGLLVETSIEVTISRYSMSDYRSLVQQIRNLQGVLIAAYYGLLTAEENGSIETFKQRFLPGSLADFRRLRQELSRTFGQVVSALAGGKAEKEVEMAHEEKERDLEKLEEAYQARAAPADGAEQEELLREMGSRLQRESAEQEEGALEPTTAGTTTHGLTLVDRQVFGRKDDLASAEASGPDPLKGMRTSFDAMAQKQLDIVASLLASGGMSEDLAQHSLKVSRPVTSVADSWGVDHVRGVQEALGKETGLAELDAVPSRSKAGEADSARSESLLTRLNYPGYRPMQDGVETEDEDAVKTGLTLLRVCSMLFALNKLVIELQHMHTLAAVTPTGTKRRYGLQIHILDSISNARQGQKAKEEEMSLQRAICELEEREYVPEQTTLLHRLLDLEQWFRSSTSIFAFKLMLALCTFAVLIWAPLVRGWFISYTLISALPNIVLALTPTLGQSFLSIITQILATATGNVFAMITLLIFRHVGGYFYNPYGIVCFLAIYAIPYAYLVHEKPSMFILGLLSMNSAGTLVMPAYVETVYAGVPNFSSAPFLAAQALAGLAIAMALVLCFQLLILRHPARHILRLALAQLIEEHLAYVTLAQGYTRALERVDASEGPSKEVVHRIDRELKRREDDLQSKVIGMNDLLEFAAVEPDWGRTKFRRDAAAKLLRANQQLLDRWTDARVAVGGEPFPANVSRRFISVLSPYRRETFVLTKTSLYLAAASMASKIPLPLETPRVGRLVPAFMHDALVLSSRFAKTEEGRETVKSGEFARYWFFLLTHQAANVHVESIQDACRMIYGSLEDKLA